MSRFGLKLMSELRAPRTLVEHALAAEGAGLEFVSISDHYLPWLPEQQHSPFAWSVLGAIAHATSEVDLATGVTCPILRYHPAVVAQAAATVAAMTDRQLVLGLGAGERLNEHVTGVRFPEVEQRHEMLGEAVAIMRELWTGDWVTRRGAHFHIDHAKVYDLPERDIQIVLAGSGDASLDLAEDCGADGVMGTEPDPALVDGWVARGGSHAGTWTEVPFAWAASVDEGRELARSRFRFGAPGWSVMSELPTPKAFDAACDTVRAEDLVDSVPSGPDPEPYVRAVRSFLDAGFEQIAIIPVGDDLDGVLRFWNEQVRPALAT
jgi:G6PDH family F420-dependent oxidoreductase